MAQLLLQAALLPIVLSPLAYLLGRRVGARSGWLSFSVMLYSTLLILMVASTIRGSEAYFEAYSWQPIGVFGLRADGLSVPFAAIVSVLSSALAIYSMPYMAHRIGEQVSGLGGQERRRAFNSKFGLYYALLLLYAAGMLGTVLATNLIQFYLFFELMLIPSYLLIADFGYGERGRISFMYFLWTHAGALLLLASILVIGFLAGSFDFGGISDASIPPNLRVWIAAALSIGLFIKLAAFGLHIWLPYAHAEAPTPISALLSPAMIGIGGYAYTRLLIFLLPSTYGLATMAIALWGVATMFYGGLMALVQDDFKRLLAYSSISQMGYMIFGIASAYYLGVAGSVLQYVSHGTGKAILFMAAGSVMLQTNGLRSISKLGGLSSRLPVTALSAMIGFLVILGAPPMNGFQAEWMLFFGSFAGALRSASSGRLLITAIALTSTVVTAGYTLLAMRRIFFGPLPEGLKGVKEAPLSMTIPLLFLAFLSVLLGVYPGLITDNLIPVMKVALGG